jgi:hypothetical protein
MPERADLQCEVHGLEYDFVARLGRIYMAEGDCCDMTACIALFKRIDPGVRTIQTFSGGVDDTVYRLIDGAWQSFAI